MRGFDKRQSVILAAVLLLGAGIGVFRIVPLLRQHQALGATMQQDRQRLNESRTRAAQVPALAEKIEDMRSQAEAFELRIPAGRGFADLWQHIADLMNDCNLSDQHVRPGQAIENDRLGAIPLTLSAVGSMQDVYAFFQAIEQWDRLIRFEQVTLTNDRDFDGTVTLDARAMVYYRIEQRQG